MSQENVPVLIVGGGIVGLSASLFLQHHGIGSLLVERHAGTSIHPRSRGVNIRTMELYREIGLEAEVQRAGALLNPAMGILKGSTLTEALKDFGPEQREAMRAAMLKGSGGGAPLPDISPVTASRSTQDLLEPELLAAARQRGGDLRFSTELVSFEQDKDGVTAIIRDRVSGKESQVRATYMLAADGANSPVRSKMGIATTGKGVLGHLLNVLFEADLTDFIRGREFSMCLIDHPEMRGLLTSINNTDRWVCHIVYHVEKGETPADYPPERCRDLLHSALGMPNLDINIKSVLPWDCAVRITDGFQHGRVFFAGDAAHQMPPWGGQGANSGIADVHNLAWKLAAVLKGQSDPSLLNTYDIERRPVGTLAAEESAEAAGEDGLFTMSSVSGELFKRRFGRIMGFGYQYDSRAIISEERELPEQNILSIDGRPGTHVPHVWGEHEGQRVSSLDLLGRGFVLLAGAEGASWCEAARALGLAAYRIAPDGDLVVADTDWQQDADISATGALLVRPDGFVAWRSIELIAEPQPALASVMARLLCKE
ncbi:FAD-dependent monooxygenase [Ktedonospora formicarum]|uniref:FAD-binding monooxygenase n=1 Tax=Ktedonospora formicarum TaxID=2778364 RepID=A0A8J3IAQ7_9CHLR|nr:FAD-dependent monooxygenase [Ktedonospora formicarum]GHO47859.1 FAD-binding monooxygenase [Ktedonospora formicarum]